MTIERMIELLEIEHECMLRCAHDDCDRKCADCKLVQEDNELHEMYTNVVGLLKEQDELLKHEYWRGYNNGRADERGLQEGTIMQTFSPD